MPAKEHHRIADSLPSKLACPACGSFSARTVGLLTSHATEGFSATTGALAECPVCTLRFLQGGASEQSLMEAYEVLPSDAWDDILRRRDFDLSLREILRRHPTGQVLDVGCFRGDFLRSLPAVYQRYGIEPSRAAREIAASRNVQFVGTSIEDCETNGTKFDVIVMMDVIEHLPRPFAALEQIRGWLAPGGSLIISTGNTKSLLWRLTPLNYWYYIAQHVSFFNPQWFRWAANKLDLDVDSVQKFSHSRRAYGKFFVWERWRSLARSSIFWLRSRAGWYPNKSQIMGSAVWPDHILVVLSSRQCRR
jgi:SAM-dependent methyltransferase